MASRRQAGSPLPGGGSNMGLPPSSAPQQPLSGLISPPWASGCISGLPLPTPPKLLIASCYWLFLSTLPRPKFLTGTYIFTLGSLSGCSGLTSHWIPRSAHCTGPNGHVPTLLPPLQAGFEQRWSKVRNTQPYGQALLKGRHTGPYWSFHFEDYRLYCPLKTNII